MSLTKLAKLRLDLLLALPFLLFFSYHPIVSLGSNATMNLELSLPLFWLIVFDLISLPFLIKSFRRPHLRILLLLLFPLYVTLSIFWSANPLRALLTAGIIWALIVAVASIRQIKDFWPSFRLSLYLSTFLVCLFCWLQCVLDLAGLGRDVTLLCAGCTYQTFGFPHPCGFAIEPQFMGNLLLVPTLLLLVENLWKTPKTQGSAGKWLLFTFFSATLFLTFSRGAIYAFLIASLIVIVTAFVKQKSPRPLLSLATIFAAFLISLVSQGLMAQISPTSDTFVSGATKSIHHLSLGIIDLRPAQNNQSAQPSSETTPVNSAQSSFDGYVAESTDVRLALTEYAVNLWHQSPARIFFGVGLGGAGTALSEAYPAEFTAKEIVQNQYASLLLETGLVGCLALLPLFVFFIRKIVSLKRNRLALVAITVAYAVSLFFFSGLPNALHIYLLLPILLISSMV